MNPSPKVRDIVLLSETRLKQLQSHLDTHWLPVMTAWIPAQQVRHLPCEATRLVDGDAALHWQAFQPTDNHCPGVWQSFTADHLERMAAFLLGLPKLSAPRTKATSPDWATDAAGQWLQALQLALLQWLQPQPVGDADTPCTLDDALSHHSGAAVIKLPVLGLCWLLAAPAHAQALPLQTKIEPLAALPTGLLNQLTSQQALTLRLALGQVDITVQDLQELQVGDVVRFGSALSKPLTAELLAHGQLKGHLLAEPGQHQGHLSLKVTRAVTPV